MRNTPPLVDSKAFRKRKRKRAMELESVQRDLHGEPIKVLGIWEHRKY
jgi:hypothetical protein